jgi:hypothetical protein
MSKDSPEIIVSIKNKFSKSQKSNPEEKGFGLALWFRHIKYVV